VQRFIAIVFSAVVLVAGLTATAQATGPTVPPICVQHDLPGGLHVEIGYCP
jgi:hypothetical protein